LTHHDTPELSIRIAKLSTKLAQATTVTGVILIITIIAQQILQPSAIKIILIPLTIFLILTALTLLSLIFALIAAATTGHLHETWETLTQ
jgi:ABC-type polysaccharide/polyol phosphate export permease